MQATTTTRRFDSRQIKQAALAIAILTSAALGGTAASIVRDAGDSDSGQAVVAIAPAAREQAFGYQFLEQNLDLPVAGALRATDRYTDDQFMEQNLNLPGSDIVPATDSTMDYRFLEMNLDLPGTSASVTLDWRLMEQNSWGEGFVSDVSTTESIPPSADDVPQQLTGESAY